MKVFVALYILAILRGALSGNLRNDNSIDISKQDSFPCHKFNFHFDDVPVTVITPWMIRLNITKFVDGDDSIVEAEDGENFPWAAMHLNENQEPDILMLSGGRREEHKYTMYKKSGGKWEKCPGLCSLEEFRVPVEDKKDFVLNISLTTEDEKFQVIGANVQSLSIRTYYPRLGYYATEVRHGNEVIWRADNDSDETCLYAEIYGTDSCMLIINADHGKKYAFRYLENNGSSWLHKPEKDYDIARGAQPFPQAQAKPVTLQESTRPAQPTSDRNTNKNDACKGTISSFRTSGALFGALIGALLGAFLCALIGFKVIPAVRTYLARRRAQS